MRSWDLNSWPDWAMFLKFWVKNYITKVAQMYRDFWAILKTSRLRKNFAGNIFWQILGKLGYFLVQYLVTLLVASRAWVSSHNRLMRATRPPKIKIMVNDLISKWPKCSEAIVQKA